MHRPAESRYIIRATRYWYGPRRTSATHRHADGTLAVYPSRAAALAAIAALDAAVYHLDHGESARPAYRPVLLRFCFADR